MNTLDDKILNALKEEVAKPLSKEAIITELEQISGKKVMLEDHEVSPKGQAEYINDIKSRAAAAGKTEEFAKICECDPTKLSDKEVSAKYKKAEKFAEEELDQQEGHPEKPNEVKEHTMSDKELVQEDDKRIDKAFQTLVACKKAIAEAQDQLTFNLSHHFLKIYDQQLTEIDEHLNSAKAAVATLGKTIRNQLKM